MTNESFCATRGPDGLDSPSAHVQKVSQRSLMTRVTKVKGLPVNREPFAEFFSQLLTDSQALLHILDFDKLLAHRIMHQLDNGVDLQLAHDGGAMGLDGSHADVQGGSYLIVACRLREQLHDFALALSQRVWGVGIATVLIQHPFQCLRRL